MPAGVVDLRSDTLTVPDAGMRAAIAAAEVGDDVWGEDPTVQRLEQDVARRLGKDAAVFVPSGTMGNLVSIAAQTRPGDEVIADAQAHVVIYEVGGSAAVAGVQLRMLDGDEGTPSPAQLDDAIRGDNIHFPVSRLLCLENTHNLRGGAAIDAARINAAARVAHEHGLRVHCDGARLFNAAVALSTPPADLVEQCDTVSVGFSKGLGAPVGSAVAGDVDVIAEVRRWRKRLGGGMRQSGLLAAAVLHALDNNIDRLAEDHANARLIADALSAAGVTVLRPRVPTNMVLIAVTSPAPGCAARLAEHGVLVTVMGPQLLRCVTHLDVSTDECRRASDELCRELSPR